MENYLYFAEGGGADATTEAALYPASRFIGVEVAEGVTLVHLPYIVIPLGNTVPEFL